MTDLVPMTEAQTFDLICRQADTLASSNIVPAAFRRKPADVIAAGLGGRAYGWDVMTSLRNFHVIEGTASLRPEAMLGLVRQAGHSVTISTGPDRATAHGKRCDTGDEHEAVFTMQDAADAGLAGKKNWKQYQTAMLTWRAVSQLCRVLFPDVVLGAGYVPEEIGGNVDGEGELIEIASEPSEPFPVASKELATGEQCDDLKAELGSLDAVDRDLIKEEWKARGFPPLDSGNLTTDELDQIVAMLPEPTYPGELLPADG